MSQHCLKPLKRILLGSLLALSLFPTAIGVVSADDLNLRDDPKGGAGERNERLSDFGSMFSNWFFQGAKTGEEGMQSLLFRIAQDIKNVFILIAVIYLIVTSIKLIFSSGKEEEMKTAIQSILWTVIGIMVMQSAYTMITILFNQGA